MHKEEVTVEGLHVTVRPEWHERVQKEIARLEKHHPGVFTRITVRFTPIKPHHPGMAVSVDGRVDLKPFNVERKGDDVPAVIHQAFEVVMRDLQDRAKRKPHVPDVVPTEMAVEEASLVEEE